jgi:CheY-like chemotaxis protein
MPEMTGTELVSLLHKRGIRIPVVVVTAFLDRHAESGSPPGVIDELLEKPIGPAELVACLSRLTKSPSTIVC